MKKIICFSLLCIAVVLATGCKNEKKTENPMDYIIGKWSLYETCYGSDCTKKNDFGIERNWDLFIDTVSCPYNSKKDVFHKGHRKFYDSDEDFKWRLSNGFDTLFTYSFLDNNADTLLVNKINKDTLELVTMEENVLIIQRFVKK